MSAKNTFAAWTVGLAFVGYLGLGVWQAFFQTTNEIGPIGMDKVGRQVFIQSLDGYLKGAIDSSTSGYSLSIESEFATTPFWRRFLQEPMRTTFRMSYHISDNTRTLDSTVGTRFLESSADSLLALYRGPVTLQENFDRSVDSVSASIHQLRAQRVRDLLAAFGFRKFELTVNGRHVTSELLPTVGRPNVLWTGSE